MTLGRVIGTVWATQKDASLAGTRMLLVQPLHADGRPSGRPTTALDTCGAGPGERVFFVTSAEAALPFDQPLTATDATIVGIVEQVSVERRDTS
jgi:ethanolamine utilization protein EutN